MAKQKLIKLYFAFLVFFDMMNLFSRREKVVQMKTDSLKEKIFVPLNHDLLFKETLAHQDNRKQLVRFLELTTHLNKEVIMNHLIVKYESILEKTKYGDKAMRGDVVIEFDRYKINLESYSYFDANSFDKSTSYIMRIFSTNLDRGKDYDCLESVIQINLIDNIEMPFDENILSEYYITNANNLEDKKLSDKFMMKYYRIDKARNIPYNELDDEMRWIRFFGAESMEERKQIAKGDELLMELDNWVEEYVNDEKTKKLFGEWADAIAIKKGIKQGYKKGIEEGIKDGKRESKIAIAKKLLEMGFKEVDIMQATGLSSQEFQTLVVQE